jgi:hypothetical protein
MMASWRFCAVLAAVAAVLVLLPAATLATPLDDYISAPDPSFSWKVNNTFRSTVLGYTAYNIELISQTWMTSNETNQPVHLPHLPIFSDVFSTSLSDYSSSCVYYIYIYLYFGPMA